MLFIWCNFQGSFCNNLSQVQRLPMITGMTNVQQFHRLPASVSYSKSRLSSRHLNASAFGYKISEASSHRSFRCMSSADVSTLPNYFHLICIINLGCILNVVHNLIKKNLRLVITVMKDIGIKIPHNLCMEEGKVI